MRVLALVLALALAGCLEAATPTVTTPPRPPHGDVARDGFRLVGDPDRAAVAPGESVTFRFVGTNEGADAEALFDPCGGGNPKIRIEDAARNALVLAPPRHRQTAPAARPAAGRATPA
mgnify:CR=1 FL=1